VKNKTKYRNHIVQISKPEKKVMKTYITLWLSKWRISPSHTHTYLPRFFMNESHFCGSEWFEKRKMACYIQK